MGELVVRTLIGTGELPAVQGVDGRWRIGRGDFEAGIRAQYALRRFRTVRGHKEITLVAAARGETAAARDSGPVDFANPGDGGQPELRVGDADGLGRYGVLEETDEGLVCGRDMAGEDAHG